MGREDGLVDVTTVLSSTLRLTNDGRIKEEECFFADDPFAVITTIARFELLFARFLVICGPRPSPLDYVSAYIAVLREITRLELEEAARREQTDESRVLLGEDGISD